MPFVPLATKPEAKPAGWHFVPVEDKPRFVPLDQGDPESASAIKPGNVARNVLLNNPVTAIGETVLNLGSQSVALPVAGLAGLATEAGRALGLTDKRGADVVHDVAGAMTYEPRGELGKAATEAVMYPFQKLAEAGQAAGTATLEATGSPMAATAVDTTIQSLPMAVAPAWKRISPQKPAAVVNSEAPLPGIEHPVATIEPALRKPEFGEALGAISRARNVDEAIAAASAATDALTDIPAPRVAAKPPPETVIAAVTPEALPDVPIADMAGPLTLQRNSSGSLVISGSAADMRIMEGYLRDGMRQQGIHLAKIIDHESGGTLRVPRTADDATVFALVSELNRMAMQSGWKVPRKAAEQQKALPPVEQEVPVGNVLTQADAPPIPPAQPSVPAPGIQAANVMQAPGGLQSILDQASGKTVTIQAVAAETGQRVQLRNQDAVKVIGEYQGTIDALEALQGRVATANLNRSIAELMDEGRIPEWVAEEVRQTTHKYVQEGYKPKEAATEAVGDLLYEYRKELGDTYSQLGINPTAFSKPALLTCIQN